MSINSYNVLGGDGYFIFINKEGFVSIDDIDV